jgi:hypothetical protein
MEDISGKDFASKLTEHRGQGDCTLPRRESHSQVGSISDFRSIAVAFPVRMSDRRVLNYQLDAMEYLMTEASGAGVKQIEKPRS